MRFITGSEKQPLLQPTGKAHRQRPVKKLLSGHSMHAALISGGKTPLIRFIGSPDHQKEALGSVFIRKVLVPAKSII
jgi:hypothetical protein